MIRIFLSHASEDKDAFVLPLFEALKAPNVQVWLDKYELIPGRNLRGQIDEGLKQCDCGVVILSPTFFRKRWTREELEGLTALEETHGKIIIPVWHGVGTSDVAEFSPTLAGRYAIRDEGDIGAIANAILLAAGVSSHTRVVVRAGLGTNFLSALASKFDLRRSNGRSSIVSTD